MSSEVSGKPAIPDPHTTAGKLADRFHAHRLPEPVFTPTTKAPVGTHDEPMTFAEVCAAVALFYVHPGRSSAALAEGS